MSLDDSVLIVEQASIIYKHQLSTLCWNENRAAMINYYHVSIPSEIDLDRYSTHPTITDIEKKFQCKWSKPYCFRSF